MHVCEEAVKKLKVVSIQCALGGVIEKRLKSAGEENVVFFSTSVWWFLTLKKTLKHKGVGPLHLLPHHLMSRCAPSLMPPTTVK